MADWSIEPILEPLFPIASFTPGSRCPHKKRIRRGSAFVCMVCHQSGKDHLPLPGLKVGSKLRDDYTSDPIPTVYTAPLDPKAKPTRKQKRAMERAAKDAVPTQS